MIGRIVLAKWGRLNLSIYSYLGLLVWAVTVTLLLQRLRVVGPLAALVVVLVVARGHGLERMRGWRTSFFLLSLCVLGPLMAAIGGDSGDTQGGLIVGLDMALRALTVTLAANAFAASVSVAELTSLFEGLGLRGLGFALGVAFNLLPTVRETALNTYHTMRLRGGFRRRPTLALRLWLTAIIVGALRHADGIVDAAQMRAFSADGPRRPMPSLAPADSLLAVFLGITGTALWLLR